MATFLQLVQDVGSDSGTVSGTLATVTGATGRWARMVSCTADAWTRIQQSRQDWTFRRKAFTGDLVIGTAEYTAAALGITDFGGWERARTRLDPFTIYDNAIGRGDESALALVGHDRWLSTYDRGTHDNARPTHLARTPDRKLAFGPTPDKAYKVRGWYRREVQVLAADATEPYIDDEYHDIIKWRALILLAEFDESAFPIGTATTNFRELYSALLKEYLPMAEL